MVRVALRGGLNTVLVVLSLLVVSGAAIVMTKNLPSSFKTGASNVTQTTTGKLVKKGTPDFAPCGKTNPSVTYGLLGAQPETPVNAKNKGPTISKTPACTPLAVSASLADSLVGHLVIASGTMQNDIFYATSLKLESGGGQGQPSPRPMLTPSGIPNRY